MREDLLKLLGMSEEKAEERQPKPQTQEQRVRRRIILRFKTRLRDESGRHYYVFWISGYTHKVYSVNPNVFASLGFYTEIEVRKKFVVIDQEDNGRMTRWLRGLLLDKARGLIP